MILGSAREVTSWKELVLFGFSAVINAIRNLRLMEFWRSSENHDIHERIHIQKIRKKHILQNVSVYCESLRFEHLKHTFQGASCLPDFPILTTRITGYFLDLDHALHRPKVDDLWRRNLHCLSCLDSCGWSQIWEIWGDFREIFGCPN